MSRKIDTMDLFACGLVGASAIATAYVYDRLPDPMPTHFDVHGTPNGWMSRPFGAFAVPVIAALVWALVRFGSRFLPGEWRERHDASPVAAVGLLLAGMLAAIHGLVLGAALSPAPRLGASVWVLLGVFFVLLGQVLPRVRRNPFIGIRTTWALSSDENWARTHRFAGYTMTLGGLLAVGAVLAGFPWLSLVFILAGALVPSAYSFMLARRA